MKKKQSAPLTFKLLGSKFKKTLIAYWKNSIVLIVKIIMARKTKNQNFKQIYKYSQSSAWRKKRVPIFKNKYYWSNYNRFTTIWGRKTNLNKVIQL